MIDDIPGFEIPGYTVNLLGSESVPALQKLLERSGDYTQLVSGELPSSAAAQNLLKDCPPGRSSEDKVVFGISTNDGSLVGVLDAMRNYPQAECWWVGLLLLDPAVRNHGVGRQIYQSFENWVGQLGAKYILLGVLEENEKAHRFWQSLGYKLVEKRPPEQFGNLNHVVLILVRNILEA